MARKVGRIKRGRLKAALRNSFRAAKPHDIRRIRGHKFSKRRRREGYFDRKRKENTRRRNVLRLKTKASIRQQVLSKRRRR